VLDDAAHDHVLAEGQALDLCRDLGGRDSVGEEDGHDVQEQLLGDCLGQQRRLSRQGGNVHRAGDVHRKELLDDGDAAVAEPLAVAGVDQELMIVEGDDLAAVEVLAVDSVVIDVLVRRAGRHVDGHDPVGAAAVAAVLQEWALHQAHQRAAVGRDGQAFHPLVGHSADRVARDLRGAHAAQVRDREVIRQLVVSDATAGRAVELIDVRPVFVGDVDAASRDPDAPGSRRAKSGSIDRPGPKLSERANRMVGAVLHGDALGSPAVFP
jgi:hypothetical protein